MLDTVCTHIKECLNFCRYFYLYATKSLLVCNCIFYHNNNNKVKNKFYGKHTQNDIANIHTKSNLKVFAKKWINEFV